MFAYEGVRENSPPHSDSVGVHWDCLSVSSQYLAILLTPASLILGTLALIPSLDSASLVSHHGHALNATLPRELGFDISLLLSQFLTTLLTFWSRPHYSQLIADSL